MNDFDNYITQCCKQTENLSELEHVKQTKEIAREIIACYKDNIASKESQMNICPINPCEEIVVKYGCLFHDIKKHPQWFDFLPYFHNKEGAALIKNPKFAVGLKKYLNSDGISNERINSIIDSISNAIRYHKKMAKYRLPKKDRITVLIVFASDKIAKIQKNDTINGKVESFYEAKKKFRKVEKHLPEQYDDLYESIIEVLNRYKPIEDYT